MIRTTLNRIASNCSHVPFSFPLGKCPNELFINATYKKTLSDLPSLYIDKMPGILAARYNQWILKYRLASIQM